MERKGSKNLIDGRRKMKKIRGGIKDRGRDKKVEVRGKEKERKRI